MSWNKRATSAGPTWKPKRCADCDRRHPNFNRDGGKPGTPWRCGRCDAVAVAIPAADPFADVQPSLL